MMRPQDVLVLLALATSSREQWTYGALARAVGLSVGEVHASVRRSSEAGLVRGFEVRRAALLEFLQHGLRYVFPAKRAGVVRGVATGVHAPVMAAVVATTEVATVWPYARGKTSGQAVAPLYDSVPAAALDDPALYGALALADVLRIGSARERKLAVELLRAALGVT